MGKRKISLRREKVEWADRGRVRPYRVVGKRKSSLRRERVEWADQGRVRPYRWWCDVGFFGFCLWLADAVNLG